MPKVAKDLEISPVCLGIRVLEGQISLFWNYFFASRVLELSLHSWWFSIFFSSSSLPSSHKLLCPKTSFSSSQMRCVLNRLGATDTLHHKRHTLISSLAKARSLCRLIHHTLFVVNRGPLSSPDGKWEWECFLIETCLRVFVSLIRIRASSWRGAVSSVHYSS